MDEAIERALESIEPELEGLALANRLRKRLDPEAARRAAELHGLRRRAREKLERAGELWLTRKGLEQATDRRVAALRAERVVRFLREEDPEAWVLDATAGIGGETMALWRAGARRVVAAEPDAATARALAHNLSVLGAPARVLRQRLERPALSPAVLLVDPDRRSEGPRSGDPARWSPAWPAVLEALSAARGGCAKLAPALDTERLPLPEGLPCHLAWTSLRGELKEVALWTGGLAEPGAPEAVVVARDGSAERLRGEPEHIAALGREEAEAVRWIVDPDPAVVRSGLLGTLAGRLGLAPLAPALAYLGGARPAPTPFGSLFEVLGSSPLDRRRVRALLAEHDVGPLVVKKRGHPDSAAQLAQRFRGKGRARGLLLVARLESGHRAYLARTAPRVRPGEANASGSPTE